jgi:enoyl-CoA hydratase/carnithine racemase
VGSRLSVARNGDILLLTLKSDDGFPRLERRILTEIQVQISKLAATHELAAAVITGTERAFSAGADISELANLTPALAFEFSRHGQCVMSAVATSPKPIVAAIRGYCMGGGLDLALACDARIASRDAVFAHPGGSLGIITGWGGTQRLPRLIGRSHALEMLIAGRRLDAEEAFACGLIQKIDDDSVIIEAVRQARTIASQARSTRE